MDMAYVSLQSRSFPQLMTNPYVSSQPSEKLISRESGTLADMPIHGDMEDAGRRESDVRTVDELVPNPASDRPVDAAAARLLARPIPQEYDAFNT